MHRIIWVYHYGTIFNNLQIDHIDGDKANNRIFNKQTNPSRFYVDVFDSLKCSRRLNIPSITWSNAPTPLIKLAGKQILCNADSTQLMAPSGFVSYTWNNGETQSSIYVREAGRYYVRLIDSLGCEVFSDTITIEKVDLDNYLSASVSGKKILEFDSTVIGGNSCIELTFTNKKKGGRGEGGEKKRTAIGS